MRAHDLVEGMNFVDVGSGLDDAGVDRELWDCTKLFAETAVNVDKGAQAIPAPVIQFGRDMMTAGVFQLPFEATFFCPPSASTAGLLAISDEDWLTIIVCEKARVSSKREDLTAVIPYFKVNVRMDPFRLAPDVRHSFIIPRYEQLFKETGRSRDADAMLAVDMVFGTTALLGSKSTEKTDVPAPERLNKARARKGKPAIGRTITLRLVGVPDRQSLAGTHASPAPHWRRGHIRRLPSGKMTPVSPSLVNWSLGEERPIPKDYLVKSPS